MSWKRENKHNFCETVTNGETTTTKKKLNKIIMMATCLRRGNGIYSVRFQEKTKTKPNIMINSHRKLSFDACVLVLIFIYVSFTEDRQRSSSECWSHGRRRGGEKNMISTKMCHEQIVSHLLCCTECCVNIIEKSFVCALAPKPTMADEHNKMMPWANVCYQWGAHSECTHIFYKS